jgi:hypothetical protein
VFRGCKIECDWFVFYVKYCNRMFVFKINRERCFDKHCLFFKCISARRLLLATPFTVGQTLTGKPGKQVLFRYSVLGSEMTLFLSASISAGKNISTQQELHAVAQDFGSYFILILWGKFILQVYNSVIKYQHLVLIPNSYK